MKEPWAQNTLGALAARTEQSSPPPLEKRWLGGDKSKEPEATGQAPSAATAPATLASSST